MTRARGSNTSLRHGAAGSQRVESWSRPCHAARGSTSRASFVCSKTQGNFDRITTRTGQRCSRSGGPAVQRRELASGGGRPRETPHELRSRPARASRRRGSPRRMGRSSRRRSTSARGPAGLRCGTPRGAARESLAWTHLRLCSWRRVCPRPLSLDPSVAPRPRRASSPGGAWPRGLARATRKSRKNSAAPALSPGPGVAECRPNARPEWPRR
jgi:hypothetical protein